MRGTRLSLRPVHPTVPNLAGRSRTGLLIIRSENEIAIVIVVDVVVVASCGGEWVVVRLMNSLEQRGRSVAEGARQVVHRGGGEGSGWTA